MRPTPLLLLAALTAAAAPAALAQSRCVTYYVAPPNAPFSYKAGFTRATWPKDCDPAGVKITKLYMQNACVSTRDNSFPAAPPACDSSGAAVDSSTATCDAVRDGAPSNVWISGDAIMGGGASEPVFDSGDVCSSSNKAYFYIQWDPTLCPGKTPPRPSLKTATGSGYRGPPCKRKASSMTQMTKTPGATRDIALEAGRSPPPPAASKSKGLNFLWAILVAVVVAALCAGIFIAAKRASAAKPPPGAGVQMGPGGAASMPPPPPGVGGPPAPGAYTPGGAPPPPPPAAAAGGGDVKYSFAPAGGAPAAAAGGGVPLTGAADGGGKPPGTGAGYPKI